MSGSIVVLPTNSAVADANGLESQLLGSAGKVSRPATMKLLRFPPAKAAQRWVKSEVRISGFHPSGIILPLADAIGC